MKTIAKPVQCEINVKKSQFICSLFPTKTKKESKEIIQKLNEQYSDATHNCTAYIVSDGEGFDDDGEPGGTAGKPMINVLRKNDLHNITAVVTRYFGGIKLGVPGLIKAYKTATQDALGQATRIGKTAAVSYHIEFDYQNMEPVMRTLKDMDIPQSGQSFDQSCSMDIRVRLSQEEDLKKRLVKYLSLIIQNV